MLFDDALDFVLPRFCRHVWTSESARDEWEPRIDKIRAALQDLTLESVNRGVRAAGLMQVRDGELDPLAGRCADRGLAVVSIKHAPSPKNSASVTALIAMQALLCGPMPAGTETVMVVRSAATETIDGWWGDAVSAELATRLGYPPCCLHFLREMVDERRLDATWSVANNSDSEAHNPSHISIRATPETNVLWAPLGVTPVPHVPCTFGCAASRHVGQQIIDLARARGYDAEIGWMKQMLSWPVSWSALHGIAETKTPILKMLTRTDATAAKYTLDWRGNPAPDSAATGLSFPHIPPRRLKVTDSRSFQRGLTNTDSAGGS
jgi:hypothetical protein